MAGNSLDVIEIDGASNNGVEQVRDLRDNARYLPARGAYKIYIIDEVHMLSTGAFNALLKILEEPPPHVKFIFATTEAHKVLPTILSRCQRFDLRRISVQDIVERLRVGCKEEGIEISEDALFAIARGAEGGLRDAESALDQIISFQGKSIEEKDVLSVFGLVSRQILEDLVSAVLQSEVSKIIQIIAEMDHSGKDFQRVVMELMEQFRNLLVILYDGKASSSLELLSNQVEFYEKQIKQTDPGRVLRIIDALIETDARMRYALSKKTLLETGLIRCSRVAETVTLNALLKQVVELKKNARPNSVTASEKQIQPVEETTQPPPNNLVQQKKKRSFDEEIKLLENQWRDVIDYMSKVDTLSRRYFIDTVPLRIEEAVLVVGVDPEFVTEKEAFEAPRIYQTLSRLIERKLDRKVRIDFEPLTSETKKVLPADHLVAEKKESSGEELSGVQKWYKNPVVKEVVEAFNGAITDVRE
jgi:DNA polymerase-3 subunit gamma/tau